MFPEEERNKDVSIPRFYSSCLHRAETSCIDIADASEVRLRAARPEVELDQGNARSSPSFHVPLDRGGEALRAPGFNEKYAACA